MKTKEIFLFILFIPLLNFGQRKEYRTAAYKGTVEAYTDFLNDFPDSKLAEKAKAGKLKACNRRAGKEIKSQADYYLYEKNKKNEKSNNYLVEKRTNELVSFMDVCRESDSLNIINGILQDVRWDKALIDNTVEGYRAFQEYYPQSKYKNEHPKKLEEATFNSAISADTESAYRDYLRVYPNSDSKFIVDSLLNASKKFALPKAALKGDILKVQEILSNSNTEMKSRALMAAVRGALYTNPNYEYDASGNLNLTSDRRFTTPRENYVEIIKRLVQNGASSKRFSYQDFGSVEVRNHVANNELRRQIENSGRAKVKSKIGGEINETLLAYGSGGISVIDVAKIHRAIDIIKWLLISVISAENGAVEKTDPRIEVEKIDYALKFKTKNLKEFVEDTLVIKTGTGNFQITPTGLFTTADDSTIQLKTELIIEKAYLHEDKDNFYVFFTDTDYDGATSWVEKISKEELKSKFVQLIRGFNLGQPIISNGFAFVGAIGFVGKIDLSTGKYAWKHDNLYDHKKYSFNGFESIVLREKTTEFLSYNLRGRKVDRVIVDNRTGKIKEIIK